jgi:hypothetical protein
LEEKYPRKFMVQTAHPVFGVLRTTPPPEWAHLPQPTEVQKEEPPVDAHDLESFMKKELKL